MRQFAEQILPAGYRDPTTVWGYGAVTTQSSKGLKIHNAPSLTIEAQYNRPVHVKWINELVDAGGHFRPICCRSTRRCTGRTLRWRGDRDSRPTFTETPGRYTGPVPLVTHAHGAVGVGDESDGYAEAWYLPVANDIPDGFATEGTWYDFFKNKAAATYGAAWVPGCATFQYPNLGEQGRPGTTTTSSA